MSAILGLDIGQAKVDAVLLREDQAAEHAQFDNRQTGFKKLWRFLKRRKATNGLHVCMEATGLYYEQIADFLHEKGATVSVVNPARIKAYAASQLARNKTDKLDATCIADFCRTQQPPVWIPPTAAWRRLRALARHLHDLRTDVQRQRNRLHAYDHAAESVAAVTTNLQQQIALLEQQIEQVKQAMDDHVDQHPDLKHDRDLISSIKGVGDLTANKLLAEFRDITRFDNVRQLVAFAGLNPKHHQSGSSVHGKSPISKMGHASIRAALYMPAVSAKQHNPILRAFAQRLEQRGLSGLAVITAVMRKLLHLIYGILKSGQPFDPQYLEKQAAHA